MDGYIILSVLIAFAVALFVRLIVQIIREQKRMDVARSACADKQRAAYLEKEKARERDELWAKNFKESEKF